MNNKSKSITLLISKSFGLSINLLSIMVIARFLSISNYGEYRQIITVVSIVVSVFSVGLPSSILYYLSNKSKKYLTNIVAALVFIVMTTLILFSYPLMWSFDSILKTNIFTNNCFLFTFIIVLSFITSIIENLFISFERFKLIILVTILPNVFFLGCVFYCYFFNNSLVLILTSLLVRELLKCIVLLYFVCKQKLSVSNIKSEKVKEVIIFGIPIGLSKIIASLNINIDKLVVGRYMDDEAFASISNGSYEIPILGLIGMSLFNVLVPNLKEKLDLRNFSEASDLWLRAGKVMLTVVIPITIGTIVFAKEIIVILFSQKYLSIVILFQIYQINAISRIYIYGTFFGCW